MMSRKKTCFEKSIKFWREGIRYGGNCDKIYCSYLCFFEFLMMTVFLIENEIQKAPLGNSDGKGTLV